MLHLTGILYPNKDGSSASTDACTTGSRVKLPKLNVPTFDGDIINWVTFWEQFKVAIHD